MLDFIAVGLSSKAFARRTERDVVSNETGIVAVFYSGRIFCRGCKRLKRIVFLLLKYIA